MILFISQQTVNLGYCFMDEQAENLTPLELKIMRCLQENGRLSNAELAKLVGISTSSCWNHTQRLLRLGPSWMCVLESIRVWCNVRLLFWSE